MSALTHNPVGGRRRLLRSVNDLPPFSPILNRLLARLSSEDVVFTEVSELIERDTVVAGSLLRVVNSALYGLAGTISSVRHGLSIIGLDKARNIVLTMSVARFWRREPSVAGWSSARFNLHSAATAVLCDLLVQYAPVEYPEGAFTAGLFHDLGKFLAASALPEEFDAVRLALAGGRDGGQACERELYGMTHAELSAAALEQWNLPAPIRRAVRLHHAPEDGADGRLSLSRAVEASDIAVNRLGISLIPFADVGSGSAEDVLRGCGLSGAAAGRLIEEFDAELEFAKTLF